MINLIYFIYAINKRKVRSASSYSIFVLTKSFPGEDVKVILFWISLYYGAHRYEILFMSHQDIASTIEKYK